MCNFKKLWLYFTIGLLLLLIILCALIHAPQIYDELNHGEKLKNHHSQAIHANAQKSNINIVKDGFGINVFGEFNSKDDLTKTIKNLEMFFTPTTQGSVITNDIQSDKKWLTILQNIAYYFSTNMETGTIRYKNNKLSIDGETLNPEVKENILAVLDRFKEDGLHVSNNIKIISPKNKKQKVKKAIYNITNNKTIEFETGKAIIKQDTYPLLNSVVDTLKSNPELSVHIQGHTDSDGDATFNQTLSEDRANAIKLFFISKGINPDKLTTVGYGDTRPAFPNTSKENKQKNRRVEFKIKGE